jgi:NTP pyrophosphatase (non-canonical NTP hydrolase)
MVSCQPIFALAHVEPVLQRLVFTLFPNLSMADDVIRPDESRPVKPAEIRLADFQLLIRNMYYDKDVERGVEGTFMWLAAEMGELAEALRNGSHEEQLGEFADVLAWLTTIANVVGVDLTEAVARKYGAGCPGCGQFVCTCDASGKP